MAAAATAEGGGGTGMEGGGTGGEGGMENGGNGGGARPLVPCLSHLKKIVNLCVA